MRDVIVSVLAVIAISIIILLTSASPRAFATESGHNTLNYREQGGAVDDVGGLLNVLAGGSLAVAAGGSFTLPTATVNTTSSIPAASSGQTYVATAEDITLTLPTVAAGLSYRFIVGSVAGSTGLTIHPAGTAKVHGNGITATTSKGVKCAHSGSRDGDTVNLYCDGTDWWITSVNGTWTLEP